MLPLSNCSVAVLQCYLLVSRLWHWLLVKRTTLKSENTARKIYISLMSKRVYNKIGEMVRFTNASHQLFKVARRELKLWMLQELEKPEPNKSRAWLCAQCNKNTRVYAGRLRHMKNANITPERKICKSIYTPTRVYNIKHWSQKFKMSSLFTNFYTFFNCPLPPFPPT